MKWYIKDPQLHEDLHKGTNAKYGNYDYSTDLRTPYLGSFYELLRQLLPAESSKVLLAGSNSGIEIPAFNEASIVALDSSNIALERLQDSYPNSKTVCGSLDDLPFSDCSFDVYACFRAITSSTVNLEKALLEAKRVSSKMIFLSVPNGYLVDGEEVNGMYDYNSKEINAKLPYDLSNKIKNYFSEYDCKCIDFPSEIILVFSKD